MEFEGLDRKNSSRIPILDYVEQPSAVVSRLAHGWEFHSATLLAPGEERNMVRDPVSAIPAAVASRLSPLRLWVVPYIECLRDGDVVRMEKPAGNTHTAVWEETPKGLQVVLACREGNAHDTGFELLGATAELLEGRLLPKENERYRQLIEHELAEKVPGEIDQDALEMKKKFEQARAGRRKEPTLDTYLAQAFSATLAEYMHGLWHDVEIRTGPAHLPVPAIRRRLELMTSLFPPNQGYRVFDDNFTEEAKGEETSSKTAL